jgi:hypothetical protein
MIVNASSDSSWESLRVETFSRKAACLAPLLALASIGHAQTAPLGTRLGEQVETTLTDAAYQQRRWDAFRLPPPLMRPSWSAGDFSAQITAAAQVSYDDNILQDNQQRIESVRSDLYPSLRFRWDPSTAPSGTGVEVFYTPQLEWFAQYSQFNTINHYAGANLAGVFGRTTGELHYQSAFYNEPDILQTSRNQTHTETVTLDVTHELGGKTRLSSEFEVGYGDIFSETRYEESGGRLLLEYQVRERLALGVGYGLRYVDTQPGLRLLFNEPQADLLWAYTDRLHVSLRVGAQIGTVDGSASAGTQTGPLVASSLFYTASDKTILRLEFSHQQWPSYYAASQLNDITRVSAGMHHRFSERVFADLDADLGYNSQNSPVTSTASAGNYSFWAVECVIGYALTPHMDCSFTYHHLERTSNLDTPSFDRNIVGARITYRF